MSDAQKTSGEANQPSGFEDILAVMLVILTLGQIGLGVIGTVAAYGQIFCLPDNPYCRPGQGPSIPWLIAIGLLWLFIASTFTVTWWTVWNSWRFPWEKRDA